MAILCVRIVSEGDRQQVIDAIGGTVLPEGNRITLWVATGRGVEEVRRIPGVEDAIVSSMSVPEQVAAWLRLLPGCQDVRPVRVTIAGTAYDGAAYRDGTFGDGGRLYLLGKRPATARKQKRLYGNEYCQAIVYRVPGDDGDWYVACYLPDETPAAPQFHPFGHSFILCRWPHEKETHGRIDQGEEKPRKRLNIDVQNVG